MRNEIGNTRKPDLQNRTGAPAKAAAQFALDWESLRTVLAVSRAKSLAGAARALELQHSTVFRRIEEVERRLGQPLFDRNRGGWTANQLGETAARAAQAMEAAALEAERQLLGADGRLAGTVRVATSEMIGGYLLARVVQPFLARHPAVEVEFDVSNRSLDLTRREADVAIRATRDPPESLVGRKLATMGYAVYAAPGLLPRGGKAPELEKLPWIGFDERLAHLNVARWFGRVLPGVRPRLRMDSLATMLRAAALGAGAAVLPTFAASQDKGLVRVTDVVPDVSMDLWLLSHPDLRGNARVRALSEHFAATIPVEISRLLEEGARCAKFAPCPEAKRRASRLAR
jgi:DNA-binding transcriptional LysR family regulator